MSKNFSIIYNLEPLSDAEREQYKRDVSVFFDLDPATNWFDILWINDEQTGLKKLQLYARRGTTDVLRDKRSINVKSMTQHDGPGYVSFTAVGVDKNGRQEIAVGAHGTEGLKGEKLAAAVSTAETRAGRRLTLKFVGLGILDYFEINQDAPLSSPAPNAELAGPPTVFPPLPTMAPNPAPSQAAIEQGVQALKDLTQKNIDAIKLGQLPAAPSLAEITAEGVAELKARPVGETAQEREIRTAEPATEPAPKVRRPRRKKNTVDLASPGQVSPEVPVSTVAEIAPANETTPTYAGTPHEALTPPTPTIPPVTAAFPLPHQPVLAPAVVVPVDFPGKPTKEEEDGYRSFLREYANNILPSAGMVPSEGIGGASAKLRLFAEKMAGKSTTQMTVTDWEEFKAFFPGFLARNSTQNLVKYINDVIGAK